MKVLTNKNLVMFLTLKTAQFLSRNGQETGMRVYNMSSDSELSNFSEWSNDDENIDVVYSQYTPYCIAIS